ncbi:MAG: PQQ-binding-like beta-propeller repeat protein, partial [Acidobacteriota bacterium]
GLDDEGRIAVLPYGRSNSPLVVEDDSGRGLVVIPAGGTEEKGYVSLLAFDRTTGEEVWRGGDQQISCASPTVGTVAGQRQILSVDTDRVAGYALDTGEVLWSHPWPGKVAANANVSQPRVVGDNQVFVSKGYGVGAALLEIGADGSVREIWHKSRSLRTKFTNVVFHQDHVYGLSDGILEAVELASGERAWKRGRYQQGQLLRAGGHLVVVSESGEVSLVEATPERPNAVLGTFEAVAGKTWNPPVLFGDILLVRNGTEATAWRLATAG